MLKFLKIKTRLAIGRPNAKAASAPVPVVMANAVPNTVPLIISGGMDAPTENAPIKASSNVAPRVTPIEISPNTMPVNVPITNGLDNKQVPNKYSALPSIATNASKIACSIV